METTLIRGLVLFLALTGFGASSITSSTRVSVKPMGANPLPCSLPSSGNTCGMD